MYYIINDIYPASAVAATLKQLIKIDKKEETSVFPDENQSITDIAHLPHKKYRRFASHILKLTPDILFKSLGISNSVISNCADKNRSLFNVFSQQLLTHGFILWWQHSPMQDTVILNDYDSSTGLFQPLSYVHVICVMENSGDESSYLLKCSCHGYKVMQCVCLSDSAGESPIEDSVLDHKSLTCMHCRFYKEYMHSF